MAKQQFYGITYPFSNDSIDKYFIDLDDEYEKGIQSSLFHLLFTPKGQKLRDPEFGCDLVQFIFSPNDETTFKEIMDEINGSVKKYIPEITIDNIKTIDLDEREHSKILTVEYRIQRFGETKKNKVSIKL